MESNVPLSPIPGNNDNDINRDNRYDNHRNDNNGGKVLAVIISGLVGLLIGGGIVWAMNMNKVDKDSSDSTDSSSQETAIDESTDGVTVGGAKMVKDKDIVDNAANASNVTTLVSLVKAADLVDTLKGEGPFTVFGPDNDAFAKLDAATLASLQLPENKAMLKNILTYHVVMGTYTSADLRVMAQNGEVLKTVQGEDITPMIEDNMIMLEDAMGNMIHIQTSDVISSNGVTHVIDTVMMPKS
jgi:uncharacterized surface protein with fasciclin (FAS1) repeats